jgi:transcriptional regulator with XRE-family HTH domain
MGHGSARLPRQGMNVAYIVSTISGGIILAIEAAMTGKLTAHPGAMIKAIRLDKGWTLSQVSEKTGLPVTTLSKIENDKISLSYDKIVRISQGLGIDISRLFGAGEAMAGGAARGVVLNGRRSVVRDNEGLAIETKTYSHLYPAAELLNKRIVPIIADCKARSRAEFGELIRHDGEEYAMVLDGMVEFHTDLYAPLLLKKGDSIYFDSSMAHGYIAAADGLCRVLSICTGESIQEALGSQSDAIAEEMPRLVGQRA